MALGDLLLRLPRIRRIAVDHPVAAALLPFFHVDPGALHDLDLDRLSTALSAAVNGPEAQGQVHVPEDVDKPVEAFSSDSRSCVLQQAIELDAAASLQSTREEPPAVRKGGGAQRFIDARLRQDPLEASGSLSGILQPEVM